MNFRRRSIVTATLALLLPLIALVPTSAPTVTAAPGDPIVPVAGQRTISSHFSTTCVILADTTVQCWGEGNEGQIGDGAEIDRPRPVAVSGLTGVVDVSAGDDTLCAVTANQRLWCWGVDWNGELGNGELDTDPSPVPVAVPGMAGTIDVSAGYDHVCAAKADGTAWCWGEGDGYELASGTTDDQESPFQIPGINDAVATAVVEQGSCVLHRDGTVSCWGDNGDGEVGNGTDDVVVLPFKVPGVEGAIDIDKLTGGATCALIDDGTIQCWGDADADWLDEQPSPMTIPLIDDAIGLRLSDETICAIRSDFSLWCAGNDDDSLPNDHPHDRETLDPTGIIDVADLALGENHGCVVLSNGDVKCWGGNYSDGRLGVGANSASDPLLIPGLNSPSAIDAGDETTCVIDTGEVWCWGSNADRLIADTDDDFVATPTRVGSAVNLVDVTVGGKHACVLDTASKVACWGVNTDGQLGTGDQLQRTTPTVVSTGNYQAVSAGGTHTCAIRVTGSAACWGDDSDGQVGNGNASSADVLDPTSIDNSVVEFTSLSAGDDHTCGVQANDRPRCWGEGVDGQLGDGLETESGVTVLVDDPTLDFGLIAAGQDSTCATRTSGLACWGMSETVAGLGMVRNVPDDKAIGGTWSSIDVDDSHACAVSTSDGSVHCWGSWFELRLTSSVVGSSYEPVLIAGVDPAIEVTTGDAHSCSLSTNLTIWCWGGNDDAQLGVASEFDVPQRVGLPAPALVNIEPTTTTPTTTTPTTTTPTTTPPATAADVFVPVEPARLVETRTGPGLETIDGVQEGIGRRTAGSELTVDVADRADVPVDASAAVINITAIGPDSVGYITAHPCLDPAPLASSLNYAAGTNLGNEIIVELDDDGNACLFISAGMDLAVDVAAYLPAGSGYEPVSPARLVDTRTNGSANTVDGLFEAEGLRLAGSDDVVRIADRGGIAADATAVVMNVTAIGASGVGFFTVHPCADPRPTAASLNYVAGVNRGNEIVAPLSDDGDVCIYTSTDTHLAVDVVGEIVATDYHPIVPARYLDTRPGQSAIAGTVEDDGVRAADETTTVPIAGIGDVPTGARTVTLNITAVAPEAVGYATVHPCLPSEPNTASLNFTPGVNGGNEVIAQLDANGDLCVFTSAPTHLTLDVAGYTT